MTGAMKAPSLLFLGLGFIAFLVLVSFLIAPRLRGSSQSGPETDPAVASQLLAAVRSADFTCDCVTRVFLQGNDDRYGEFWNIQCANGSAYQISIPPRGGESKVLDCAVIRALCTTECFTKFTRSR
jgi:hypothetical protein